jgi:hypothetical protein
MLSPLPTVLGRIVAVVIIGIPITGLILASLISGGNVNPPPPNNNHTGKRNINSNGIDLHDSFKEFDRKISLTRLGNHIYLAELPTSFVGKTAGSQFCYALQDGTLGRVIVAPLNSVHADMQLLIYRTKAGVHKIGGFVSSDAAEQLRKFNSKSPVEFELYMQPHDDFKQFAGIPTIYVVRATATSLADGGEMLTLVLKAPEPQ